MPRSESYTLRMQVHGFSATSICCDNECTCRYFSVHSRNGPNLLFCPTHECHTNFFSMWWKLYSCTRVERLADAGSYWRVALHWKRANSFKAWIPFQQHPLSRTPSAATRAVQLYVHHCSSINTKTLCFSLRLCALYRHNDFQFLRNRIGESLCGKSYWHRRHFKIKHWKENDVTCRSIVK
jgi:hypothetical protein